MVDPMEDTSDTPLIVCVGPNSVMVGRGGETGPTYYYQIVPRIDEAIQCALVASTHDATDGGPNLAVPRSFHGWQWPSHVRHLAADELLIVVFPTEWSREQRCILARSVFEDLSASAAVFVCSAVACGYALGMGLEGDDTHAALYKDIPVKRTVRRRNKSVTSDVSETSQSESESSCSSPSTSSRSQKVVKVRRRGGASGEQVDHTRRVSIDSAVDAVSIGPFLPIRTPRMTTRLCIVELHYDRLTMSIVSDGAVSRFVAVPRLPSIASDKHSSLISFREASNQALLNWWQSEGELRKQPRGSAFQPHLTGSQAEQLVNTPFTVLEAPFSHASNGMVPATMAKLEAKVVADAQCEDDHEGIKTSHHNLQIDFQLAVCFTGEAATIVGFREALTTHFPMTSESPHSTSHRHLLPSVVTSPILPQSLKEGHPPSFVADLTPFLGASILSTVPDKVIEKVSVTRSMFFEKGSDIVLTRSAL